MKHILFRIAMLGVFILCNVQSVFAQRQMETLGRGVIATQMGGGKVAVSWRLLGSDPDEIGFNLYRSTGDDPHIKVNKVPIAKSTFHIDSGVDLSKAHAWS